LSVRDWRGWIATGLTGGCLAGAALYFGRGRWLMAAGWMALSLVPVWARLPRGRRAWFAVAAIALSVAATFAFVFGIDLYLHHKFARTGGYNVWGYRGPVAGKKRPGEQRVVMLGGSVAFGFGVSSDQTIPYYLEARLNTPPGARPVSVVNLGWNGEGAYSFQFTLPAYEYLDYDAAILYSGYNDLLDDNRLAFRNQSAVFRLTGYLPILPIIPIREWAHIDDLSASARDGRVVFRPGLADRYTAEAAETALRITQALERQLGRMAPADNPGPVTETDCERYYTNYCRALMTATDYARHRGKQVFVVTEPYIDGHQIRQQASVTLMMSRTYGDDPRVHYVNLGRSVDLKDTTLCYDGMHLTAAGNARVADALAPAIRDALER
jgi:hypothetical protein